MGNYGRKRSENLMRRIKKIYERTEVMIRTKDGVTERLRSFVVGKGVRQGCVLSPTLFSLYIIDGVLG